MSGRRALLCSIVALCALSGSCAPEICREDGLALYERRIEPLFLEDRPTTCNQCHLTGVDLTLFVRETPCETMACLVELDLVDLQSPEESLVLSWIGRAEPGSALITEDVIAEEHDAFLAWITHTAQCGGLEECAGARCGPAPTGECDLEVVDVQDDPYEPDPADCSPRAREQAFLQRVYAWRGRCFPCHFQGTSLGTFGAPRWIVADQECGPAAVSSMSNLFELDVIDWEEPARSRFLLKPLSEAAGGIAHGGHDKYEDTEDEMYRSVRGWIEYEAGCR